jgi:ribulose-phosphate 3-epimerase
MKSPHLVAPSLLSADFSNLQKEVEMINCSEADWIHIDVMDGRFVPNITIGFSAINAIKKHARKPLDVHLMIVEPEKYISEFKEAGADILTIHYEACTHLHRTIQSISELGMKPGVALNPHTPIYLLEDILQDLDMVLIMSVNPGFGGQDFIENTKQKIKTLSKIIHNKKLDVLIEIDGGVDLSNAANLVDIGTDVLVAGNTIFRSENPLKTISALKNFHQ